MDLTTIENANIRILPPNCIIQFFIYIYLLYMTEQFQLLTEQLSLQSQQTMNPESVVSSTSGANCLMLIYLMLGGRVPSTWLTA